MACKTLSEALVIITKRFGKGILHNRSHVIACLKDLLPEQKSARNVLDAAFAMGIAEKFDEVCGKAIQRQQAVLSQCSMQLCDDHGFQKELVDDVLWAYGIAMGFDAKPEPMQKSAPNQVPKSSPQPMPSTQAISVNDIAMQYYENIVASDMQYLGKRLKLTGTVECVQKERDNRIYIAISSKHCPFRDSRAYIVVSQQIAVAQLKRGQTIEFMGTIEKFQYNELNIINCELL